MLGRPELSARLAAAAASSDKKQNQSRGGRGAGPHKHAGPDRVEGPEAEHLGAGGDEHVVGGVAALHVL